MSDILTYKLRSIQAKKFAESEDPTVKIRKPLDVVIDNDTRWLSQLYMIRRALKLRPYLEILLVQRRKDWREENTLKNGRLKVKVQLPPILQDKNKLTDADWSILQVFAELLQYFEGAVKTLEGDGIQCKRKRGTESYGNIWDVLIGYEFLLGHLEKAKSLINQYPEPEHFKVNINLAWKKLDQYYNKLNDTPIYYATVALHPAYHWGYFEVKWATKPEWISMAKDMVKELWEGEYKRQEVIMPDENDEPPAKRQKAVYYNAFQEYRDEQILVSPSPLPTISIFNEDEYER